MSAMKRVQNLVSQMGGADVHVSALPAASSSGALVVPRQAPVKVVVTGAAGNIGYALVFIIAQGRLLGPNQKIELRLLDLPAMEKRLEGVAMELRDSAFSVFSKIVCCTDYEKAFKDVEVALLVGAKPRGPGMVRADLLKANASIFAGQGKALDRFANKNVRVVVVGNPANTNALITLKNAPSLNPRNFAALTRLDQNRAVNQLQRRINAPVENIANVIIWGNHSKSQYPDVNHGVVRNYPKAGLVTSIRAAVNDDEWLNGEFIKKVAYRGAEVIKQLGKSSAASAANATVDCIRDWICGSGPGRFVNMGVYSNGNPYGIPDDIVYSFPLTTKHGEWSIVEGLKISDFSRAKMQATADELVQERKDALGL